MSGSPFGDTVQHRVLSLAQQGWGCGRAVVSEHIRRESLQQPTDISQTGCARFAGQPAMFLVCLLLAAVGVAAYLSNNEHFVSGANLSISIVTLLLLPILQSTQNRDGAALQAKIDELIKASGKARDDLIGLENREEEEIESIRLNDGQRSDD